MVTGPDHSIVYVNASFERVTGYRSEDVLGRTPWLLYEGSGNEEVYDEVLHCLEEQEPVRRRVSIRTADGDTLHTLHTVTPNAHTDPQHRRNVSTLTDITELIETTEELRVRALTDDLTGLPNRRAGEVRLRSLLRSLTPESPPVSVALVDIDHFKRINDTYGHLVGDRVLRELGQRLDIILRGQDTAARWGGEEFLLILPGAAVESALRTAERVRAAVASIPDHQVGGLTVSIGVGQAGIGESAEALLARVDHALYAAKRSGRNRVSGTAAA